MIFVEQVLMMSAWVLVVFLGFSFLYESLGRPSFFPEELVLPAFVSRMFGVLFSVGGLAALVWQLIRLH